MEEPFQDLESGSSEGRLTRGSTRASIQPLVATEENRVQQVSPHEVAQRLQQQQQQNQESIVVGAIVEINVELILSLFNDLTLEQKAYLQTWHGTRAKVVSRSQHGHWLLDATHVDQELNSFEFPTESLTLAPQQHVVLQNSQAWRGHEFCRLKIPLIERLTAMARGKTLHCLSSPRSPSQVDPGIALKPFLRALQEETSHVVIPSHVTPPHCYCSVGCALRMIQPVQCDGDDDSAPQREPAQGGEGELWVCKSGKCMYFEVEIAPEETFSRPASPKRIGHHPSSLSEDRDRVERVMAAAAAYVQNFNRAQHQEGADQEGCVADLVDSEASAQQGNISSRDTSTATQIPTNGVSVAEFWKWADEKMIVPDEDLVKVLLQSMTMPICACGVATTPVLDSVTGDLHCACAKRTCHFLRFSTDRPVALEMDAGQFVKIGHSPIDRYTTVSALMQWFGRSFSEAFFTSLKRRNPDAASDDLSSDYPPGSYELPPDTEYDLFVSYRGKTGRIFNWLALVRQWNLLPGFYWACFVCPLILVIILFSIENPCGKGIPKIFLGPLDCIRPADAISVAAIQLATWMPPYAGGDNVLYGYIMSPFVWFIFLPYAPFVLVAVILFWYPTVSYLEEWFGEPYRIFYDKFSINQCDLKTSQQGLMRMCLYLRSSKELLCLFDAEYIDRMWCIFELAVYLKLRVKPKVTFVSVSQNSVEVITIVLVNISYVLMGWVMYTQVNSSVKANGSLDPEDGFGGFLPPYYFFQLVVVNSIIFVLGQQHQRSLSALTEAVDTFDVRQCQLGAEQDRSNLVRYIVELFSPTMAAGFHSQEEGISAFNDEVRKLVRSQLPLTGIKSWKLFSFVPAVLGFAMSHLWAIYDVWSYDDETAYSWNNGFLHGFNTVLLFCFLQPFVLWPLNTWALGAIIRFFWWFQGHLCRWTGLSYKASMAIGLVLYLIIDVIIPFRQMLFLQIYFVFQSAWTGGEFQLIFAPFQNISWLWFSNSLVLPDGTYWATTYDLGRFFGFYGADPRDPNWYFLAFSVVLATVLTIFCYYIYEPRWSRELRPRLWRRLRGLEPKESSAGTLLPSSLKLVSDRISMGSSKAAEANSYIGKCSSVTSEEMRYNGTELSTVNRDADSSRDSKPQ